MSLFFGKFSVNYKNFAECFPHSEQYHQLGVLFVLMLYSCLSCLFYAISWEKDVAICLYSALTCIGGSWYVLMEEDSAQISQPLVCLHWSHRVISSSSPCVHCATACLSSLWRETVVYSVGHIGNQP